MIIRKTSLPLALGLALALAACEKPSSQGPGFQHAVPGKAVVTVSGVEISEPIFESFAAAQGLTPRRPRTARRGSSSPTSSPTWNCCRRTRRARS